MVGLVQNFPLERSAILAIEARAPLELLLFCCSHNGQNCMHENLPIL